MRRFVNCTELRKLEEARHARHTAVARMASRGVAGPGVLGHFLVRGGDVGKDGDADDGVQVGNGRIQK